MKIPMEDLEKLIDHYSSKASEYCHHLGIAGIGIIWVLNTRDYHAPCTSRLLLAIAFLLFIVTITVSLIHYFSLAKRADNHYHYHAREFEKDGIIDSASLSKKLVDEDPKIESYSWMFFDIKFYTLILAYVLTMTFVVINLFRL
jgi:hypothetical protein